MKYQSLSSFEKHLEEAAPDHLSSVYMVVSSHDYEKTKIIEKIASCFLQSDPNIPLFHFDASLGLEKALEQLNTTSLFSGKTIVVLQGIEKLKKQGIEQLGAYLASPSSFSTLILGASSLKGLSELYQKGKKEMVVLDLSDEKSWDHQRRLKEWLVQKVTKEGKTIESDAVTHLLEDIGPDMAALEQEMNKLICYIGERKQIQRKDVLLICSSKDLSTGWQIAEVLVWEEKKEPHDVLDLSALLPLIGQIRYHLSLGLQIQELEKKGEEISRHLNVRPAQLDKYLSVIKKRRPSFFKEGLYALFDLELLCKSSSLSVSFLWGHFVSKLHHLKIKPCPFPPSFSFPIS